MFVDYFNIIILRSCTKFVSACFFLHFGIHVIITSVLLLIYVYKGYESV